MAERPFLSIGEVLSLLKDEFPDITISKIRFLESQGLLDPERTPSGYRKFYEADVERLRWILRQQREHFLPLKVIKGRLAGEEPGDGDGEPAEELAREPAEEGGAAAARERVVAGRRTPGGAAAPAAASAGGTEAAVPPYKLHHQTPLSAGPSGVNLTIEELAAASGLRRDQLVELERSGFIGGRPVGGVVYYDEESLVVANLAAGFLRYGIETRHLRAYKNAADREAALLEQIVTPLLKQRNPQARAQAVETLNELTRMGQSLRAAMVRQALRGLTGG